MLIALSYHGGAIYCQIGSGYQAWQPARMMLPY